MNAFDEIEEQIERQENRLKARELKRRLDEIEKELARPVEREPEVDSPKVEIVPPAKSKLAKKWVTLGKFALIAASVVVVTYIAAWVAKILLIAGIVWVAYKLFLNGK